MTLSNNSFDIIPDYYKLSGGGYTPFRSFLVNGKLTRFMGASLN